MAPVGERNDSLVEEDGNNDETENLWATILSEVQSKSASALPTSKSLLILGDNESGKTTLIARLQGTEEPKKGAGLEYYYINVKDEYRDDQDRLGVWVLDGDPTHTGLLKYALNEGNFPHTVAVIVVSMSQPWTVMDSLQKWCTVLRDHVDRLKIPSEELREYEQSLVRFFQEYVEFEEGQSASKGGRREVNPLHPSASTGDEEKVLLPLGETTLTQNLGIPIVIVVTKSDTISMLEKEHDYKEEHFDFIQQHIRKFSLNYGAALLYTSVKEDKNCDLLLRYMCHRIYGFPFTSSAYVVERDCVFVPTGWENEKKISILYENLNSMKAEDAFEDVIVKPVTRKPIQRDAEISAEDEQVFLMKQQGQLSKQPAAGAAGESPIRTPGNVPKTSSPRTPSGSSGSLSGTPKKMDGAKGSSTSEGVLANFFNSLLTKKSGGAAGPPSKIEKTGASREAAAEYERMSRAQKTSASDTPTNDSSASSPSS